MIKKKTWKYLAFIFEQTLPWLASFRRGNYGIGLLVMVIEGANVFVLLRAHLLGKLEAVAKSTEGVVGLLFLLFLTVALRLLARWGGWGGKGTQKGGEGTSHLRMALRRVGRNPKGIVGLLIPLCFIYLAFLAPFISSDPLTMHFMDRLKPPSSAHLFGTDKYGRGIFSRIIHGGRISLGIGASATFLNILLGAVLGLLAGYYRGAVDAVIMRILEVANSIPFLVIAILVMAVFGSSIPMLVLVLSVFALHPARIVRSQVLELRENDYVQAARALGAGGRQIIFSHLLPNLLATLLIIGSIRVGKNILSLAGLSFLGLGVTPPTPSWGAMLQEGRSLILRAPWIGIFPGIAIFLTVLSFNLLGDALRDALDPKLRVGVGE